MAVVSSPVLGSEERTLQELTQPQQKVWRFKQWFEQSHRAFDRWRAEALESRRFVSGEQWSDGDLERMKSSTRPALVINKILPRVLFLSGMQRSQRMEPEILPQESGDSRHAELMGTLLKHFGALSHEPVVDSRVFMHKIVDGLGYWKVTWSYDYDLEGQLRWERVDPLAIFPDPNWLDQGWEAAEYAIHATWLTLAQATHEWPEHRQAIRAQFGEWLNESVGGTRSGYGAGEFAGDSLSGERAFWDRETQRIRLLEVWYKQRVKVPAALVGEEIITDPERVALLKLVVERDPSARAEVRFVRVPICRVRVAYLLDDVLLSDAPSPYDEPCFPLFPDLGYYWTGRPFGIVEPLKDLQREKNKRRSTIIEMIMRAALSGWYNPASGGAKTADLENYAAGLGKIINYQTTKPEPIKAPELPQTLVFLDTQADRDMDSVSNIHAELLGTTTQRTVSGRAIRARQESGLIVQEPLLEGFAQAKEPAVRFAVGLIRQLLSPPRALRILGTRARRDTAGPEAEMLQQMELADVLDLLQGAFDERYDVVVGQKPFQPSSGQQKWQVIAEMLAQFGEWIPPEVAASAAVGAGLLSEEEGQQTVQWIKMKLGMEQQQAQGGASPAGPGGPPAGPNALGPDQGAALAATAAAMR